MTPLLARLADAFHVLPGVGRRSAERMALAVARDPEGLRALARALEAAAAGVRVCPLCGDLTEEGGDGACRLCTDPRRDDRFLCVVAESADVARIEGSGVFYGRYFALGARVSPKRGVAPDPARLEALFARAAAADEIFLAFDGSTEGETTALFLREKLAGRLPGKKVTRLAFGLPAGGSLAYADPVTLARAIQGRTDA